MITIVTNMKTSTIITGMIIIIAMIITPILITVISITITIIVRIAIKALPSELRCSAFSKLIPLWCTAGGTCTIQRCTKPVLP